MNDTLRGRIQIEDSLAARIRRLEGVRLVGVMDGLEGQRLVLCNDDLGTGSSFVWPAGESLGMALKRLEQRYREAGP